jgi:hypothetical protein
MGKPFLSVVCVILPLDARMQLEAGDAATPPGNVAAEKQCAAARADFGQLPTYFWA